MSSYFSLASCLLQLLFFSSGIFSYVHGFSIVGDTKRSTVFLQSHQPDDNWKQRIKPKYIQDNERLGTSSSRTSTLLRRRELITEHIPITVTSMIFTNGLSINNPPCADAVERPPLSDLLYRIVRVREATQQETRLITTGYFKDAQRANVKLAIKFMIENYNLNDAFVAASTYIDGTTATRLEAGQVGQRAVQNLYTILEYFDAADVQNLKVRFKEFHLCIDNVHCHEFIFHQSLGRFMKFFCIRLRICNILLSVYDILIVEFAVYFFFVLF